MGRRGDIESKSVASRVPMAVYLELMRMSSSQKMTLSSFICEILSHEDNIIELHYENNESIKKLEKQIMRHQLELEEERKKYAELESKYVEAMGTLKHFIEVEKNKKP